MAQKEPDKQHELRVIVLGGKQSGKISLIDRTLGPGDHSPRCLQMRQGEVGGRRVVMVNTVGWWRNFLLVDTAEFIKQKLQLSVSMCPPGPHAFLLTVMIDLPFDEDNRRAIKEHMRLFGENIWRHTIVVFTRGETLEGKTIDQHIEKQGKALTWLLEKCGKRYFVFNNQDSEDGQVTELLEQIDNVKRINDGTHFQFDERTRQEVEEKTRKVREKAAARRMIQEMQRQGQVWPTSEITILMLGWLGSRKTTAKNVILNRDKQSTKRTQSARMHSEEVEGVKITVVDTPGWWKFFPAECNPERVKTELRRSLTLTTGHPQTILLAVPSDTTFQEEQRQITEDNMKMFGEQVWRHTIVLFTCGDLLGDTSIEEHIESEGEPLRWLVDKCENRYHVFDNFNRGDGSQVRELLEKIKKMEAPNESFAVGQTPEQSEMENRENGELSKLLNDLWEEENEQMEENILKSSFESKDAQVNFAVESHDYQDPVNESYQNLPQELKEMFEQEFRGRKTIVMERCWNTYLKEYPADDGSESVKHNYQQAVEKVTWWLENWIRERRRQEVIQKERSGETFDWSEHEGQPFCGDGSSGHDSSGHGSCTDDEDSDYAEV